MVDPSVGVGDIAVMGLFPAELVDHVLAGCRVESSKHGVGMNDGGFGWRGNGSGGRLALESDIGDGCEGGERSRWRFSSEDGSLEVEWGHGWGWGKESRVGKVVTNDNRHVVCVCVSLFSR